MPKNNYFYYTNEHKDFLHYLLSFATEQYQDEDPLLSGCAKDLIRYILGMKEMENVEVTELYKAYTVNHDTFIMIGGARDVALPVDHSEDIKEQYFIHYDPSTYFTMEPLEGWRVMYLSMKKLREICKKYPSKDPIFLKHTQFLDEQISRIETTLQTPIRQWDEDDYRRFSSHLVEDSVIDMSRTVEGRWIHMYKSLYSHSLYWYYTPADKLERMGVSESVPYIFLKTRLNSINIGYASYNDDDPCVQKLRDFVRGIHRMPIFFDLSDYKEKIQYAQSIMDRLEAEFSL